MADNYYDKKIEEENSKLTKYGKLVDIAFDYLEAKNSHKQKSLESAWEKVRAAKSPKERTSRFNTFLKVLHEDKAFRSRRVSTTEVENKIADRFKYLTKIMDYSMTYDYASEISYKALEVIEQYAREYISAVRQIESLKAQKEEAAKRKVEDERKEREDLEETPSYRTGRSTYTPSYEEPKREDKVNVKVGSEVIYHEYDSFEEKQKKAIDYLVKKIEESKTHGYMYLSYDEERMLEKVLGEGKYLTVTDMLESGLSIQAIYNNFKKYNKESKIPFKNPSYTPSLEDLYKVASEITNHLPDELMRPSYALNPEGKYELQLRNLSKMSASLEMYDVMYNIYLTYFNKLKNEEKEKIKDKFRNNKIFDYYKDKFKIDDFEILSTSKLKIFVNEEVRDKMMQNYLNYLNDNPDNVRAITRACTYMTVQEMVSTYYAIKSKYNTYSTVYPGPDEERQRERHNKNLTDLQLNFALAILNKKNLGELTTVERNRQLEIIVKEDLHEEVKFALGETKETHEEVNEVTEEKTEGKTEVAEDGLYHYRAGDHESKTVNRAVAARYNAQHRFFGMSKLQQTMARMSGKWNRFNELWNRALRATGEEQEQIADELDSMFRR